MVDSSGTLSFWAILLSFLANLLSFWQLYLSFWYFFIYFHQNHWFYWLFRLFHGKKMSFFTPKGEKSSGRLSFLLKYFKNPPVHWVFLKNWAWVFLKLEFFRLEFFSKCPKKSLVYWYPPIMGGVDTMYYKNKKGNRKSISIIKNEDFRYEYLLFVMRSDFK